VLETKFVTGVRECVMNPWHQSARAHWPGCIITGDRGPFALVVARLFNPPLVYLYSSVDAAKSDQAQRGGQVQRIEPMKMPKPVASTSHLRALPRGAFVEIDTLTGVNYYAEIVQRVRSFKRK